MTSAAGASPGEFYHHRKRIVWAGIVGNVMRHLLTLTPQDVAGISLANDELYVVELPQGFPPKVFKFIPQANFKEL